MSAGGKRVDWVRDPVEVFAYHVNVPAGVESLDIDFRFTSPVDGNDSILLPSDD